MFDFVSTSKSPDLHFLTDFGASIAWRALKIAKEDFLDISLLGSDSIRKRAVLTVCSMLRVVGKTRPLPGHSSIGSIRTRKQLRSGVPPPTTESNKRGSVPVIWQTPGMALTWTLILHQCLFGDTEERYHQPIDRSGLTPVNRPVYSEAWAKGNAKVSPGHQSPPYGRSVGQRERKGSPEHHFPPYGTPHTANIRVEKPKKGKEEKEQWDDKKRVENREGSLGHPGYVTPVFTKDSKPLGEKQKITGAPRDCDTRTHLKKVLVRSGRYSQSKLHEKSEICLRASFFKPYHVSPHQHIPLASPFVWLFALPKATNNVIFADLTWFATPCSMVVCCPRTAYYHPSESVGRIRQNPVYVK
ncbi:hypothetical protein TNCV_1703531 [Trichonephila clavipes]|nr:hypothetical protein TNCV_1703531 [Trichonephila clavipes]